MTNNEERREVAARLRGMADSRYCDTKNTLVLACALFAVSGVDAASGTAEDIMRRLADLIEPEPERTCEFDSQACGKRRCNRCGAFVSVDSVWDCFSRIPVRYCPNCGAKVVD